MSLLERSPKRAGALTDLAREGVRIAAPTARRVGQTAGHASPLGWCVVAATVGCWILGAVFDWVELTTLAAFGVLLLVLCALMTIGRARLDVQVGVEPLRVTVGDPSTGHVQVVNRARGVLFPIRLELPVGKAAARFEMPALRSGQEHEELFVVPTERRGVVPIGPAMTVRGDPLGIARRTVSWTDVLELFVHPVTVPLESLGAGLLRDLEGQTTNDVSMSDLAFHALRDYQPGDDRRYIHWRSSAKAGRFLVRQFLDTRRWHLATVVDSNAASYADPDEFELAISAAASMAVRAVMDEQDVTVVAGDQASQAVQGRRVLDSFARAELTTTGLAAASARAAHMAADISIAILLTGSLLDHASLRRAASHFPPETLVLAMRIDRAARTSVQNFGSMTVLTLQSLRQLPALMSGALA